MLNELQLTDESLSLAEVRERFGSLLGLEEPMPLPVLRHALDDQYYRHNLLLCREWPHQLQMLLEHPKNAEYSDPLPSEEALRADAEEEAAQRGNLELLAKAGSSFLAWGKSGFTRVDNETFERRFSACQGCDRLVEPPEKVLYKLTLSGDRIGSKICSACGCVASRKARLTTESCPLADPENPGFTRWGEPARTTTQPSSSEATVDEAGAP